MNGKGRRARQLTALGLLLNFPATFLPVAFAGQRLLGPELLARLQIKGVPLDLLNNVLLLDLSLEAAKGVF